jgi:hypothetical protein
VTDARLSVALISAVSAPFLTVLAFLLGFFWHSFDTAEHALLTFSLACFFLCQILGFLAAAVSEEEE